MLLLIAVATVATLATMTLIREAPRWWRSVDTSDTATLELGEKVEHAMLHTFSKRRPEGVAWSVAISANEANAWLNTRLPRWVTNRGLGWPESLDQIQAQFNDDKISLGFRILTDDGGQQIVAATVAPMVDDRGSLWLTIDRALAGRLDLPRNWTIARLREWLPEQMMKRESTERVVNALAGDAPLLVDAAIKLDDARQVRILDIRAKDGGLLITCVTERE
ncbi:MAG: hypothetical protein VYC34_04620 [Planctomycetota bacterium]|nr:hypothetical protein [Planctomycetota bacterium]